MGSLGLTFIVLLIGWLAYSRAKRSGTWSNKLFFGVLGAMLLLVAVIVLGGFLSGRPVLIALVPVLVFLTIRRLARDRAGRS